MIPIDIGQMTAEIILNIVMFFEVTYAVVLNSAAQWMVSFGNGFFNVALNLCSGFITSTPANMSPDAWNAMKAFATGPMAIGIAEDLVIVFFLISIIDYALSVRSKVDLEDIMKMVGRAFFAQFLVFNYMNILEGLWLVCSKVITTINPAKDINVLSKIGLVFGTTASFIMLIMALVYMIVMIMLSFKIITTFWQKYIWAYLMIPFGAPAFAVVVGTGHWNTTARAYVKFLVSLIAEFIAIAFFIVLLGHISTPFKDTLIQWMSDGIGMKDNYLLTLVITYLSNICFAGMAAGMITKLDNQVNKMLAL